MYGQRGMPDDDATDNAPSPVARRSAESPPTPPEPPRHPGTPSRAALDDGPRRFRGSHLHERPRHADPDTAPEAPEDRRHWYVLTALGLVLALLVGAMYLLFGRSDTPGPGPVATTAPPASSPASAVAEPTTQTPSASGTASTDAPPSPTDPSSPTALPVDPLPTAGTATPEPSAAPTGVPLNLGEATIVVRPGWRLYADEVVQDDRRLIRMSEVGTDTRIQAVVLTTVDPDLREACLVLMGDQSQGYTGVAESLAVTVMTDDTAEAVSCAFTGVRASDSVPNKVEFTLIRRALDSMTLFFRDTVPTSVPEDSPVLAQLTQIECDAAATFGVSVTACQITPGQADG